MLSRVEDELLTRVEPGTPMGDVMRRYWMPALLSEEVAEPHSDPARVRLLGEDLVAFRRDRGQTLRVLPRHGAEPSSRPRTFDARPVHALHCALLLSGPPARSWAHRRRAYVGLRYLRQPDARDRPRESASPAQDHARGGRFSGWRESAQRRQQRPPGPGRDARPEKLLRNRRQSPRGSCRGSTIGPRSISERRTLGSWKIWCPSICRP